MNSPKEAPASIYLRIDPAVYFQELVELGFKDEHAREIVGWLQVISDSKTRWAIGAFILSRKENKRYKSLLSIHRQSCVR